MTLQIEFNPDWRVGDIIKVQGKNHRIVKKTTTAIATERYYWFDKLMDRWTKHE